MNDNKCPWVLKKWGITEGFLEKGFIPTQRSPNRSLWPGLTGAGCPPTPALPEHCQGGWACSRVTVPTGHLAFSWPQQLCPLRSWKFKGNTHRWVQGRLHESLLVNDHTTRIAALWCCPTIRPHPLPADAVPTAHGAAKTTAQTSFLLPLKPSVSPSLTLRRWSLASSHAQKQPGS